MSKSLDFLANGQMSFEKASLIVAPIPFEGAISYMAGAAKGPKAILEASAQVELYDDETGIDLETTRIHTVKIPQLKNLAAMQKFVRQTVSKVKIGPQFYLGIGGDHTVTTPAIEALAKAGRKFGIVQIDAHADLRDTLHGDKYSHACIMRRNAEIIGPKNIVQIGIRAVSLEEREYIRKNKVKHISGNFALHDNLVPRARKLFADLPDEIFLTVDLDGLDPTIMPHVGTPVPGGLSWYQTISVIRELFKMKTVIAADVVEIASGPGTDRSDFAAALLCQKIAAFWKNKVS